MGRRKKDPEQPEGTVYYKRAFLNDPGWHSSAFIIAQIDEQDTYPTLQISDCDRKITMALDGENEECRAHTMRKLDALYKTIRDFRKALKREWEKNPPKE